MQAHALSKPSPVSSSPPPLPPPPPPSPYILVIDMGTRGQDDVISLLLLLASTTRFHVKGIIVTGSDPVNRACIARYWTRMAKYDDEDIVVVPHRFSKIPYKKTPYRMPDGVDVPERSALLMKRFTDTQDFIAEQVEIHGKDLGIICIGPHNLIEEMCVTHPDTLKSIGYMILAGLSHEVSLVLSDDVKFNVFLENDTYGITLKPRHLPPSMIDREWEEHECTESVIILSLLYMDILDRTTKDIRRIIKRTLSTIPFA